MTDFMLKQYSILVDFLGKSLGPDYEVALHDIGYDTNSIVAISNGNISGRTIGAPMTDLALSIVSEKSYKNSNYKINYKGISKEQRILRSSTMFIKDEDDELVGLLCINFDNKKYVELSNQILSLCQPDNLIEQNNTYESINSLLDDESESFSGSIAELTETVLNKALADKNIPIDRLTQSERLDIINALNKKKNFYAQRSCERSCKKTSLFRSQHLSLPQQAQ